MQGIKRKVVYVTLYEAIAIAVTTAGFALVADRSVALAGPLSVACSVVAIVWNLAFNTVFEAWERRQTRKGRSLRRRIAHAIGFEGGLIAFLVPLIAWWLSVSLWQALVMDLGLVLFFLVYSFAFAWAFDHVFGLPASALPAVWTAVEAKAPVPPPPVNG